MPNNNDALKQYNRQWVRWYIKYKKWKRSDPDTRGPEPERPVKPPVESKSNKGVMNMKVSHDIPPHRYELELAWKDKAFIDEGKIGF